MEVKTYTVPYNKEQGTPLINAFAYWHDRVRAPGVDPNSIHSKFSRWLRVTYNLKWTSGDCEHVITSYSDEDWVRFMLEWGN